MRKELLLKKEDEGSKLGEEGRKGGKKKGERGLDRKWLACLWHNEVT